MAMRFMTIMGARDDIKELKGIKDNGRVMAVCLVAEMEAIRFAGKLITILQGSEYFRSPSLLVPTKERVQ